jgi:hypothetical protein
MMCWRSSALRTPETVGRKTAAAPAPAAILRCQEITLPLQKIINGFVMEKHYSKMGFFNEYY